MNIIEADFSDPNHSDAIIKLLNEYALDPMGGGRELPDHVKTNIVRELQKRDYVHGILAFANGEAAGMIISFEGFSTFAGRPLLNIHDIIVTEKLRGKGLAKKMLQKAEEIAVDLGCCKLTLEVLEGNTAAQAAYSSLGYSGYQLDPKMGKAMFWEKKLENTKAAPLR